MLPYFYGEIKVFKLPDISQNNVASCLDVTGSLSTNVVFTNLLLTATEKEF